MPLDCPPKRFWLQSASVAARPTIPRCQQDLFSSLGVFRCQDDCRLIARTPTSTLPQSDPVHVEGLGARNICGPSCDAYRRKCACCTKEVRRRWNIERGWPKSRNADTCNGAQVLLMTSRFLWGSHLLLVDWQNLFHGCVLPLLCQIEECCRVASPLCVTADTWLQFSHACEA